MPLETFSGLNTLEDPTNLPPFASPDCPDVEFVPGTVQTRPPLVTQFTIVGGNPSINYLKTYITPSEILRMMALDSFGSLWKENPAGTLALAGLIEVPGAYANSVTLFGREYLAIGDGQFGIGMPRQFDDTFFDRVSQEGPGAAPTVLETTPSIAVASASQEGSIPVNAADEYVPHLTQLQCPFFGPFIHVGNNCLITVAGVGADYDGPQNYFGTPLDTPPNIYFPNPISPTPIVVPAAGTVASSYATITTAIPHGLSVGSSVIIAGVGGYSGTFPVAAVLSPTVFTYFASATGLGALGAGGTIQISGNVSAGAHQCVVMFVTRQGYITKPSPPGSYTATGGKTATVTLPIGPPNIIARIVAFTGANGDNFYYIDPADPSFPTSGMVIHDNTTTSATFDFDDQTLLSGNNVDDLFSLVVLGECSGVTEYHQRLFWTGERNTDTSSPTAQNSANGGSFYGLGFDGGFGAMGAGIPNGWSPSTNSVGANSAIAVGSPVVWGDALSIIGDGVSAVVGHIYQNAYQDYLGIPIIARNTAYSLRVRVRGLGGLASGNLHINLTSTVGGFTTTGLSLTAAQVNGTYQEFIVPLTDAPLATPPADLRLQIYVDNTLSFNASYLMDCMEIFPTQLPYNSYLVRASFAERPEAYDGVTGFLSVAENNGQAVRNCFVLRDFLYLVKERSMYVTQDNGDEPSTWSINEVSAKVGTESPRGVGVGDEWAVIASRDGLYYFNGGLSAAWSGGESNSKLSTEIQPTWDSINWNVGYLISVVVDTQRKRIYVAVPIGTSTVPNKILTLDYVEGFGDPLAANGVGRKWSVWNIPCNSQALIERFDGTQKLFIGNNPVTFGSLTPGTGTGKIYGLIPGAASSDDGVAINGYWNSGFFQDQGRLTFGYVAANITGSGTANLTLRRGDQNDLRVVRGWNLLPNGFNNMERQIQVERERMAIAIGTNGVNQFFSLQGLAMYVKPSSWAILRGTNA